MAAQSIYRAGTTASDVLSYYALDYASFATVEHAVGNDLYNILTIESDIVGSPFTVTGAHAQWVGSTDTPSHAAKELKMR